MALFPSLELEDEQRVGEGPPSHESDCWGKGAQREAQTMSRPALLGMVDPVFETLLLFSPMRIKVGRLSGGERL